MKRTLSIFQANLLYLATMVLVIIAGSLMQIASPVWGLIGTEVLLILLPVVLLLRGNGIPLREGLRLRPIGLGTAVLCALTGLSIWFFGAFIDTWMMQTGWLPAAVILPAAVTLQEMPQSGALEAILNFAALAVFAPVCEEALFRGAIQGAYERRRSAAFAIAITSLMFAFYHFRLAGLPALLPIAFILGYIGWRTQSLYAVILVHFGNNAMKVLYGLLAPNIHGFELSVTSPILAAVSLVATLGLIFAIRRRVAAPASETAEETAAETRSGPLRMYWPLAAAGLLFTTVIGLALGGVFTPQQTVTEGVTLREPAWTEPFEQRYLITNQLGGEVGEARCRITPGSETTTLECSRQVEGYEIREGNSFFSEDTHTLEWSAAWDAETLALVDFELTRFDASGAQMLHAALEGSELAVTGSDLDERADLGTDLLLGHEWPWRFMYADAQAGSAYQVQFGYLLTWDEEVQRSRPQAREEVLRMLPRDPVSVPAGEFDAWKITIGNDKAAWYSGDEIPRLLRYDDGMSIYSLAE